MNHSLYSGQVWHKRFKPKVHQFQYQLQLFWLDLQDTDSLNALPFVSTRGFAPIRFKRSDYLDQPKQNLADVARNKMSALANKPLQGQVFLLGQLRWFGLYFSPVNFYYLRQADGYFSHVLAEVSNTPWNQRHCYLVDLANPIDTVKAFHVSPFNPMNMHYQWTFNQPQHDLKVQISCIAQKKEFVASLAMTKKALNPNSLTSVLLSTMTLKTLAGIYWQALKLLIKGTPVYGHPSSTKES
ncbi:DUF1365 domain-containing protein [Bowmanella denitrificans]|uniref:DUF1365 domain-containing protein n=1 Tax=Bowmanella denitrificans TaxID=366582 RepID=UPI000C9C3EEB|nr:DUF1365 domain-containing protein [Bowmanella denitrificans]